MTTGEKNRLKTNLRRAMGSMRGRYERGQVTREAYLAVLTSSLAKLDEINAR